MFHAKKNIIETVYINTQHAHTRTKQNKHCRVASRRLVVIIEIKKRFREHKNKQNLIFLL